MFNKKIKFCIINKDMLDIWPAPKPSAYFVPPEYKELKRHKIFLDTKKPNLHAPTVKTCIPFLDSMTAGYIIPFDQDYLVDPTEEDFSVIPANREQNDIGFHDKTQLPRAWHSITGINAGKFINKWLIKTPPGYSCLFIHPLNRFKEDRFEIISGIVDTDTYINTINFPFILKKRDKQFLIKKGEAMVQVIPFKRESWKMWSGFYLEKLHQKTLNLLGSEWIDRYKKMFWQKKNFK
tara:strand:+ start:3306 stop:4013 length:708 start_codon:yes stop_codon:yes gene_type:complete